MTGSKISAAPAITFLWVKTFPLAIYGPLVLPLLIVFIITVSPAGSRRNNLSSASICSAWLFDWLAGCLLAC